MSEQAACDQGSRRAEWQEGQQAVGGDHSDPTASVLPTVQTRKWGLAEMRWPTHATMCVGLQTFASPATNP